MKKYITRITTFFMISLFLSSCYSEKSLLVTPSDNNQTYKIDSCSNTMDAKYIASTTEATTYTLLIAMVK